jgi:hypothetical protein
MDGPGSPALGRSRHAFPAGAHPEGDVGKQANALLAGTAGPRRAPFQAVTSRALGHSGFCQDLSRYLPGRPAPVTPSAEGRRGSQGAAGGTRARFLASPVPVAASEHEFDNRLTDDAEAVLTFGRSGWPVWVTTPTASSTGGVLEVIEPENTAASPADSNRYILLVDGPFAFLKGMDGEQYITATRRGDRWWITPNTSVNPRRGFPPGE